MKVTFCPTGKIVHPTKKHAMDHLKSIKRGKTVISRSHGRPPTSREIHAYRCGQCGGWHVGHAIGKGTGWRKRIEAKMGGDA